MRVIQIFLILAVCTCTLHAQQSNTAKKLNIHKQASLLLEELPSQNLQTFFNSKFESFGFDQDVKMIPISEKLGKSGMLHSKFQQTYKGLKIIGAQYILHSRHNLVGKANGYIAPNIQLDITPSIDLQDVKSIASDFIINEMIGAAEYQESIKVNVHATSLCIIDQAFPDFSGSYKLAYQTFAEANTIHPIHEKIYIDAKSGNVISNFTEVCDHSVPGKAKTRYYGVKDIITDSIAPNSYVLRDSTRGVITLNGPTRDNALELKYPDFYDDDNYWDNVNTDFNEVAGDAHYCTSSFHDFMLDEFNWKGMDNEGGDYIAVVHASRRFMTNAYWDGNQVSIGNGDCDEYGPLTVLDVIGHEFTHGIIDETCDLVYRDESGALNESIADIFGKSLEYKYDQENFTWLIGHRFRVDQSTDKAFRNMQDPTEERDPKFYNGEHWHYSASDRGGVHTNSGVLNYWYYLLVEGEAGTNEVGYEYDVKAIGMDDALQILFGSMTGYFTPSTNYVDAMSLTLEQTKDLFGLNSQQYESVLEAWMTVGLYEGINDYDLSVLEYDEEYFGCPDSEIYPNILVRNTGTKAYDAGTSINLRYEFDGFTQEVAESVVLEEDLMPGDSLFYTFLTPIVFEPDMKDDVSLIVDNIDNLLANNSYVADLEFSDTPGSDLKVTEFEFRIEDPCNPTTLSRYRIGYRNDGCLPIVEADSVKLKITTDLQELIVPFIIYNSIDPGNVTLSFRDPPIELEFGFTEYRAEIIFDRDSDPSNNAFEGTFAIPEGIEEGYLEEFVDPDYRDRLNISTSSFSGADSVIIFKETEMLAVASKRSSASYEDCIDPEDFFNQNSKPSVISACIDATGMQEPTFGMNLTQIRNGIGSTLREEFRAMVMVSSDSLKYPLIYDQVNEKVEYHEFALPVDYVGGLVIQVYVHAGSPSAFTTVGLEELDAVLFDKLELFDKADRPTVLEPYSYDVYPTLVEDEIQIFTPDVNEPYDFLIFDVLGRLIGSERLLGNQVLSMSQYPSGTYVYQIKENARQVQTGKFVRVQ